MPRPPKPSVPVVLLALGVAAAGCGLRPAAPPAPPQDRCAESDGPTPGAVARSIAAIPDGADWVETARGHTGNCRLYWVKLGRPEATPDGPEQVLFFDHDTPLGAAAPHPRPYLTVLSAGVNTVTVLYQWRVGDDPVCCPTGGRTTRYQIGPDGHLQAD